ncbi:MAG: V-type ATP synthase subunit D [Candidatus Micrarchaeia archaeon]
MSVNPTRINLINTKKSIVLAKKGHSLLKRKREVLVIEFLKLMKESTHDRDFLYPLLQESYKNVAIAYSYVGDFELEQSSNYIKEPERVRITQKNIMGVKIPEIEKSNKPFNLIENGYSLMSTDVSVDDANESIKNILDIIIDVAKREQGLKRLVLEIEKVKRRVNALEYILLPNLNTQAKYISLRLEEIDRDTFSELKHVKKKLQKANDRVK